MGNYLSKFPTLEFFLKNWVERELSSKKNEHILLHYLSEGEPNWAKIESLKKGGIDAATCIIIDELQNNHNYLTTLDAYLNIVRNEPHLDKLLEHLKQDFWQGYSEIEITALFKQQFNLIELEPKLKNGKSVDFSFVLNKKKIFVEVNTPKMGQKISEVLKKHSVNIRDKPKVFDVPDNTERVKDIILREFDHFNRAEVPSLIIYNLSNSEVHGNDIGDRLLGTAYVEIITDKTTGNSSLNWRRKADTVFINDPDLKNLGGIICYKGAFNIKGQMKFYSLDLISITSPISDMQRIAQSFLSEPH